MANGRTCSYLFGVIVRVMAFKLNASGRMCAILRV